MAGGHDHRHTVITELSENGTSREAIKSMVGHVSDAMVERYSHMNPQNRIHLIVLSVVAGVQAIYTGEFRFVSTGTRAEGKEYISPVSPVDRSLSGRYCSGPMKFVMPYVEGTQSFFFVSERAAERHTT